MITPILRSVVSARRNVKVDAQPAPVFNPMTLFGSTDDGALIVPANMDSLRKRVNGDEVVAAENDPVAVAIAVERDLALGIELVADPTLASSSGWTGFGGAGYWQYDSVAGTIKIASAATVTDARHDGRGLVAGALYLASINVASVSSGGVGLRLGINSGTSLNSGTFAASTGEKTWSLIAGAGGDWIRPIAATSGTTAAFTSLSVKRYLGRYARAASDAARPLLKTDGTAWWLEKAGSESLKLWGGALTGCTVCYASNEGVTLLEGQDVGADYEILRDLKLYGMCIINRTLSAQDKVGLQDWMGKLITGEADITPEPPGDPSPTWVNLGTTSKTSFYSRIDSATPHTFKATGANAATHEWESVGAPSGVAVNLTTVGLTAPVTIELEGAALDDASTTHFSIGTNELTGAFPPVSNMTALRELYMARNLKASPIKSIGALPSLEVFYAFNNGATGWESTVIPASMRDLKLYGNAFNQATVDTILTQANAAQMGTGCTVDLSGSNASPSSDGWDTRDALVARGCAVNVSGEDPRVGVPTTVKWFPGHYVFIEKRSNSAYLDENNLGLQSAHTDSASYSIVRGVQVRYIWKELEPTTQGVYRFDKILADADYLASKGRYLIIQLNHKSFGLSQNIVPPYMETALYEGGQLGIGSGTTPETFVQKGWVMRWWNQGVKDRYLALVEALAAAVDGHPNIALFNINESAVNRPPDTPNWSAWVNNGKIWFPTLGALFRTWFKKTPVVTYINAFPDWFPAYEAAANVTGCGFGGPDHAIYAYEDGIFLVPSYDLMKRMTGKAPICLSVQYPNYPLIDIRGGTINDIFLFARDTIGVNFQTWGRRDPYWADVKTLWSGLPARYPSDPAGGLPSAFPTLLKE